LKFSGQEKGLFRRLEGTVEFDDAVMFKIAKESTGRCFIYKPVTAGRDTEPPVYLKTVGWPLRRVWREEILQTLRSEVSLRRRSPARQPDFDFAASHCLYFSRSCSTSFKQKAITAASSR
jgi:hypothetical protein